MIANRLNSINESPTIKMSARASVLRAAGHDIVNLSVGEPDFDTPVHIKEAARIAIDSGFTKYTLASGTVGLKNAISNKLKRQYKVNYASNEIIVCSGGKQAIFNLILALIDPEDEVIIPAPYWVSYPDIVRAAEGLPVFVECSIEQNFKITPDQLDKAITSKTKLLILNSPSNPTGAVYTRTELLSIGTALKKYPHVLIATDDIYEQINLGSGELTNIIDVVPDLRSRIILLNGVSKAYAMTGWRIGYAAGPAAIIKAMEIIQSQSTSCPCSISQVAAEAALTGDQACIQLMINEYRIRHNFVIARLRAIKGVQCRDAAGAFYLFPDVRTIIKRLYAEGKLRAASDIALSEYLLEIAGVAVVPGSAFGIEGYIRISFATSMDNLSNALDRIEIALG